MPKIKPLGVYADRKETTRRVLSIGMARKDMSIDDLDKRQIINKSTMYLRRKEPDTLRLGELWKLGDVLKLTDEEILQMFGRGEVIR